MNKEYEIKLLDIHVSDVITKLTDLGFKARAKQDFKRYVYSLSIANTWLRLRSDQTTNTVTYKSFAHDAIDGVQELELAVNDFDKMHELLQVLGFKDFVYQENRRQRFYLDDVEVSIDEWPHIPSYLEIEASSKQQVEKYLKLINVADYKTTSKPTSHVYSLYGKDIESYRHLAFKR